MSKNEISYEDKYERRIQQMAESHLYAGSYKMFDQDARIITREMINEELCLVIANREGETIVLTPFFERMLADAISNKKD